MPITLRPHQIAACNAVEDAFRAGINRPLVDACVGSGKSLMFAELARREIGRGGRVIIGAHTRELVEQNAQACRDLMPGVHVGINAAALRERTWRAPVISAAIQSVYQHAGSFGPISMLCVDEAHLLGHQENGMYHDLHRALGKPRMPGGSGTVFRMQGGSLVEGEGAPFDKVVFRYSIIDGIHDGYLCPAFSIGADDKMDPTRLRTSKGEYTGESQDAQMIAAMDNHIAQMVHHGSDRRAWLIFEASTKASHAMAARMNEWGIPTGLVLGTTPAAERAHVIEQYRTGRLRALVNLAALTTGFNVPAVDLLVMRRRTKSLGLYIQICGRALRTAPCKTDCAVLDFAGNIDQHGPLDFIRPKETKSRLVSCEACGKRNGAAAAKCWSCDATMLKTCPACLEAIAKHHLDCPLCGHDMRQGTRLDKVGDGLLALPSGAALIAAYKPGAERQGGWLPVRRVYDSPEGAVVDLGASRVMLPAALASWGKSARWLRLDTGGAVAAVLVPNGSSRSHALQVGADGAEIIVPLPGVAATPEAA
jgi:DNA repair protein RadD